MRKLSLPISFLVSTIIGVIVGAVSFYLPPLKVLGTLVAIMLIMVTSKRPELIILGILIFTSTVIGEEKMLRVPIGFGHMYVTDICLFSLLGMVVLRSLTQPKFRIIRTTLDWPILCFLGFALLSTTVAVFQPSLTIKSTINEVRYISYYLFFFVVTNLIRESKQVIILLKGLLFLGTLVAIAMIIQYSLGESATILGAKILTVSTEGKNYEGVIRILPPGEPLILVAFMIITILLIQTKFKATNILIFFQWSLLGLALILTFRRSVWVAMGLELLILGYVVKGLTKLRYIGWTLLILLLIMMISFPILSQPKSQAAKLTAVVLKRLESFIDINTYKNKQTSTLRWREFEYEYAIPQIISHPIIGLGLGAQYRPWLWGYDYENFDGRDYIHNGHLYIMLKSGLLGYLSLLWFSLVFLQRGFKYWQGIDDPLIKAGMLGITLTYLGALISAISEPRFMDWEWITVFGIILGINEVIIVRFFKPQEYNH